MSMPFAILGSGRGSNARALLTAWKEGRLNGAEPVGVFSDKPEAPILHFGREFGVPARYLDPGKFKTKLSPEREEAWARALQEAGAEWIVLAGFMRVVKEPLLRAFPKKILNLHPSLLPSFKGLHAIEQAWNYGVKVTGCTVHYVTGDLDGGPIIDQAVVRIEDSDTLASLEEKIHAAEHRLLPEVVARLAAEASA